MKDITGQRFGKLVVIEKAYKDTRGEWKWLCKCDCGNTKIVSGNKLRTGNTRSCGCYQKEIRNSGVLRRTHGLSDKRIYVEWRNMKARCEYPKNYMYAYYGARGIHLCAEWHDFEKFANWAFSHGYSDEMTIERIDVNGDYCPGNCKWVPAKDQYLNRTDSHFLTAFGKTQTLKEWADEYNLKYDTLHARIKYYGMSVEEALTRGLHKGRAKKRE